MKIAMFTDSYFPQVSGVATSIKVLVDGLRARGHQVTIFTTTDPDAQVEEEQDIVRIMSVPFLFFTDRRVAIGGMNKALMVARREGFDLVHTHTDGTTAWKKGQIIYPETKHVYINVGGPSALKGTLQTLKAAFGK